MTTQSDRPGASPDAGRSHDSRPATPPTPPEPTVVCGPGPITPPQSPPLPVVGPASSNRGLGLSEQRLEVALRESEMRYRGVVENTLVGIAISKNESILYANQTLIRMGGYASLAELAARPVSAHLTPASAALAQGYFEARARGEAVPPEFDVEAVRKDGTARVLRLCTSSVWLEGRKCELSTFLDVTDQRRAEAERLELQRRLLHTQKLESLGVLAGGIAHDFNNLLMAILGNLDMALSELPPGSPARSSLEQAMQASRRATDLTRGMLAYSGRGRLLLRRLDLSQLVRETVDLLRSALARTVTLDLNLAPESALVEADSGQMQQVAMNLITNASEALGGRPGTVTLRTGVQYCGESDLAPSRLEARPAPGRFAYIEVSDDGCGMDEATQQRLFDPFFTTKATGRGLGMSAVLGIVRAHKGAVLVNSRVGRGTTVRVLFPALAAGESCVALTPAVVAGPVPPPLSGLVLVVDDDDGVRGLTVAYAKRLGLKTLSAADGVEALALFGEHADEIACVLLDLTMPRLDGVATYREMKQRRPDIPIVLCSGYTEQDAAQHFHGEGLAGFLQKPYELSQLRRVLDLSRGHSSDEHLSGHGSH